MREKIINLVFVFFVFALGAISMYFVNSKLLSDNSTTTIKEINKVTENRNITITDNDISEAVANVYDSVVMIKNYQKNKYAGSGSGFVYKTDDKYGYILTNYHVVKDATKLSVLYSNEEEVSAEYLSGDEYLDLAVVRVSKNSVIKVASLGKTSELALGDTVFAVGSPVGEEYYNSITRGIVSGLNRKITVSVQSTNDWFMKAIQIDAAINPGNSGGPLVNGKGEVIGINSMKLVDSSVEGMGFSIMIEDALAYTDLFEKINNPEEIKNLKEIQQAKEAEKQKRLKAELKEHIEKFDIAELAFLAYSNQTITDKDLKAKLRAYLNPKNDLSFVWFDNINDKIKTSQCISVNKKEGVALLKLWEAGKLKHGMTISCYTVLEVRENYIQIGCHKIPVENLKALLNQLKVNKAA